jgi:alkylhydroperoxidase family enzyme
MQSRLEYKKIAPAAYKAMRELEAYVQQSDLEPSLLGAYCIDMHTQDARARGESEQRLYALTAWEETPFYTERERAALAWTEAVTEVTRGHVPDEVYALARQQFAEEELVDLTMAIIAINGWNRLSISFRTVPGTYRSPLHR